MRFFILLLFAADICAKRAELGYSDRQRLVGAWGQDSAGAVQGGQSTFEHSLGETCEKSKFDILKVSFVNALFDVRNKDSLPSLNLSPHCTNTISQDYPHLLRCPEIEEDIKKCQQLGKKVILSIGGATGDGTLPSPAKARELANTLYALFLGGSISDGASSLRPFGTAIMDGIDLDIQGGRSDYYGDFIKEMRRLMDADQDKEYLLTGSPQCPYPDHYLGPGGQTGLELAGELVDHLYIQFYNNICHIGAGQSFYSSLKQWLDFSKSRKPRGPLIFIGMPAHTMAAMNAEHYLPPNELQPLYEKAGDQPFVGGIMLWDVSWDQANVIDGKRYSEYAFHLLKDSTTTTTTIITVPPGDFCHDKSDGHYAYPDDNTKYYSCDKGIATIHDCPSGLRFDVTLRTCTF